MPVGLPEFVENSATRCPAVLLLDTSASMSGSPIQELRRGLELFKQDVMRDAQAALSVEVAIITFGGRATLVQDFVDVHDFQPPSLETNGTTPMGSAIEQALDLVEKRKLDYKDGGVNYYRPWIFLITDGAPTDAWESAAFRVREEVSRNKALFFAVGVEGADMHTLSQIAPPEYPPLRLNGLDFRELFQWLSSSMKRVSHGKVGEALALPPVTWGQITT